MTMTADHPVSLNEAFVRAFVAVGSGIDTRYVVPSQVAGAPIPSVRPFASVLLITDTPMGRVTKRDVDDGDGIWNLQYKMATYSVQFYGAGAAEAASRLCGWIESDAGLLAADGALWSTTGHWPDGTAMRIDVPVEWKRLDGIVDDDWEQRALINLPCRYATQWKETDKSITDVTFEIVNS